MSIEQAFSDLRMDMSTVVAVFSNAGTKYRRAQRYRWADSHRRNLIESGKYIRTSERRPACNLHWPGCKCRMDGRAFVGEAGPELVKLPSQHDAARRALRAACLDEMEDMPHPADDMESLTCHCGRIACRHHQEEP